MHSSRLAASANEEQTMYEYDEHAGIGEVDGEQHTPFPVDAAAALAAAFGIGFHDMANDRTSPLDQLGATPVAEVLEVVEPIPSWQDGGDGQGDGSASRSGNGEENEVMPMDAAAALAASFGIGFDFGGMGEGNADTMDGTENGEWSRHQNVPESRPSVRIPEVVVERYEEQREDDVEPPVDAAAALAASFGLGFDDVESRDRRMGNIGGLAEGNEETERASAEDQASKGAKLKRRFKKRTGTTRERTGCLTCRQRRKKCDDNTYPICGHCRRLNLECVREAPRPIHISVGNTTQHSSSQPASAPQYYNAQPVQPPGSTTPPPNHQNALTHRRHSQGSPSSFGDLSHVAMHGVNFRVSIPPCLAQPLCSDTPSSFPSSTSPSHGGSDRRYLLKYYTQVLASLVTTNHENNSFLSVFLPMAIDSPPLLSALTAWSCAHLSRFHEPYAQPLLHKRGAALRLMAESLASPSPSLAMQETLLAASLVLCSTEVINGDTEGMWLRHLEGASLIIKSAKNGLKEGPEALRGTGDGEWLLRNFAYHDVLGTVTLGKPPLIRGAYWLDEDGRNGMVDTYMGVGSEVLAFISEISCLTIPAQETNGDAQMDVEVSFEQRAEELEQGLLDWTAPPAIQAGLVPLAEAWRSAALLYLYRKKRAYLQSLIHGSSSAADLEHLASLIAQTTTEALTHLSSIPPSSLPESGLLFPIFLAGGETRNGEEMELVRRRMKEMEGFRGFANIGKAMEVLEEVWRCWGTGVKVKDGEGNGRGNAGEGREVRWEDVCKRRGWVLVLA